MSYSPFTQANRSIRTLALTDLISGLVMWRIWVALSWQDFRMTYRRTLFGVMWVTLTFAVFIFIKIAIFSQFLGNNDSKYFNIYLASGFFIFQMIVTSLNSSPSCFVASAAWIKNDSLPLSLHVYRQVAREFYSFMFTGVSLVGIFAYLQYPLGPHAYLSIFAVILFFLNVTWIKLFLGVIGTRFRDVNQLVQTAMRPMFFLCPIFWTTEQMGGLMKYLWWNPIYHFMEIFRNPLIDQAVTIESWYFVGVVTIVGWITAIATFTFFRHRIAFWL